LRFVKALGLLVEGRAQVSMNLTNFKQTPIARVAELVKREAARYGVGIHHSELVGLIPQEALVDAASWHLQVDGLKPEQILEQRLYDVQAGKQLLPPQFEQTEFLDELARGTPSPGGGSAAAFTGAEAAALVSMVARLTVGKSKYSVYETEMWQIIEQSESLRADLTACVAKDALAFDQVLAARRLPKDTPEHQETRNRAILQATEQACLIPYQVVTHADAVLSLSLRTAQVGNINAVSDAAAAALLAKAALTGAALNVRINASTIPDSLVVRPILEKLNELEVHSGQVDDEIFRVLQERAQIDL
jgi:glutamate formiminotransferase/formiminotetrahydrofolate cyclodeaminase